MKFCPHCELRLKKLGDSLSCPKCNYKVGDEQKNSSSEISDADSEFNILDQKEVDETLPTIKIDCEKCGHDEAVWWMLQTRSADEPTTQFYRCTKCSHTWRNYA